MHASGAFAPCRGLLPQCASAVPATPVTALRALPLRSARRALLLRECKEAAETDEGAADFAAWSVIDWQDEEGRFGTLTASSAFVSPVFTPSRELWQARAAAGLAT